MQEVKYGISFFKNYFSTIADEKELTFNEILKYFNKASLRKFKSKETSEAMICGPFKKGKRTSDSLKHRSIITYDIDYFKHNLETLLNYVKDTLKDFTYIYYTTVSSTYDKPKLRLLLFVNQNITVEQYPNVSLNFAKDLMGDLFKSKNYIKTNNMIDSAIDKSSYVASHLMNLPSKVEGFLAGKNFNEMVNINKYVNVEESVKEVPEDFVIQVKNVPLNLSDEKVKEVLSNYNIEETNYHSWFKVAQGLHHQYQGSEKGYNLFLAWSLADSRYSKSEIKRETKKAYYNLNVNNPNPVTFASTIKIVNLKLAESKKINCQKNIPIEMDYDLFLHVKKNAKGNITGVKTTYENFEILCDFYGIKMSYEVIGKDIINSLNEDKNVFLTTLKSLLNLNGMDKGLAADFCYKKSMSNETNILKTTLDSIKWDGVSRLNDFYNTLEVEEEFIKMRNTYLLKWCQQMLYQALTTGDKLICRQILILKGKQGLRKSSWSKMLLPSNMSRYIGEGMVLDTSRDMKIYAIIKHLIVELAELEQSFKSTDVNQFKSFLGVTKDTLNMKYLSEPVTYTRTTSFIGTINDDCFLKDRSGHTRFLVIPVTKVTSSRNLDILQVYKEILETTDYTNFNLNEEEVEFQKQVNSEFEQPVLLEEVFLSNFEIDFEEGGQYLNCSEILTQLGFSIRDLTYSRKADIKHIVTKYNFKYRKNIKKWLVKLKGTGI